MTFDYRPRFSFDITEAQHERKNRLGLTHGIQKAVFQVILDDFMDLVEQHGQMICGIIIDRRVRPRDILPSLTQSAKKAGD
jgi:hypothetical protein